MKIKPGDHVLHRPSGETWVVAYADYESGHLSPCGWPEGRADLSDCELVKSASDEKSRALIGRWAAKENSDDHRSRVVRRLYCKDTPS